MNIVFVHYFATDTFSAPAGAVCQSLMFRRFNYSRNLFIWHLSSLVLKRAMSTFYTYMYRFFSTQA